MPTNTPIRAEKVGGRIVGKRSAEGTYVIEVSDSGRGLPPDFDMGRPRGSLGMRVVSTLAKQLNAKIATGSASRERGSC